MVLRSTVLFLVTHHMVSSNTLRYHIIYIYISCICIHNIIHDIFYSIYIYIYIYKLYIIIINIIYEYIYIYIYIYIRIIIDPIHTHIIQY